MRLNKDNSNSGIGGLASSHHPDNLNLSDLKNKTPANLDSNAPLLSVLHQNINTSTSTPTLQFESTSGLLDELEDSEDDAPRSGEKRSGRRKIKIEYIEDKSRRHITFSKRKAGIMKKAYELSTLTGTQVLLLVASETGHVYTFATPKLQPLITKQEGKNLIQACLNSPDSHSSIPEYIPAVSNSTGQVPVSQYENELGDDELTPRSASTVVTSAQLHAYLPVNTTTISPSNTSAASVAAAAAQVFMSSAHSSQYTTYPQSAASSSGPYWNGNSNAASMYAPVPGKSSQQSQQQLQQLQQSQQQQQMYHAMYQQQHHQQQQQQLYQQYQQQQQQQQHNQSHPHNTKQSESEDH